MLSGAKILVSTLRELNVKKIFAISGAGNLEVLDALLEDDSIEIVYMHHEQAVVMAAQGYARVSGEIGIALVTTGGGSSNAITGILSAFLDSIPLIIISGNESSYHFESMKNLRAIGVQGFISTKATKDLTKLSTIICSVSEIPNTLKHAYAVATLGRKGPVHIDFPMDIQRTPIESNAQESKSIITYLSENRNKYYPRLNSRLVEESQNSLNQAKKPLFYLGNGLRNSKYLETLISFLETNLIPFCLSWSAIDLIESEHPLNFGRIGLYGNRHSNIILQQADLLFCLGTRLAIPQIGYDPNDFGRNANKIVVDIDQGELDKLPTDKWIKIHADANEFLESFLINFDYNPTKNNIDWIENLKMIKLRLPLKSQIGGREENYVHSFDVIEFLNSHAKSDAIFVTDVGAGLLTGHYGISLKKNQRFFTSQGLGEMGFGLPAAIGAYFAANQKQVICLNTDGGIMFNLQELQVVNHHNIPLKLFIFNNNGYTMIKHSQKNLFNGREAGSTPETGISFPSFRKLADCFNLEYTKIKKPSDLNENLIEVLNNSSPSLIDINMSENQVYLPRLATKKLSTGQLSSPPIEDLDPLIPIELLEELLNDRAIESSYEIRNLSKK